jgi:1-deoxyxylulose-5-phosphate synthase
MDYPRLGSSGLKVSSLVLGAARFGEIDDDLAARVVDAAIDLGVSSFDTADIYNAGTSEEQLGRAIRRHRDRIVLCTKVGMRVGDTEADFAKSELDHAERWKRGIAPTDQGLSRKHVTQAVHDSLRRLGTDYIDLYQVHRFDSDTPIEETVETLDDLVHDGLVRYVGCSGFAAQQLAAALDSASGGTRFVSIQSTYSLVSRHAEQELLPLCREREVGVLAFGAVAGGMLTGRYTPQEEPRADTRLGSRQVFKRIYFTEAVFEVVERLKAVADATGRTVSQLAVGWVGAQPGVTSVLLGISRPEQLHDVIDVFERPLSPEELQLVEAATTG